MKGQNNLTIGKYLGQIGNDGITINENGTFVCDSNVIRVAASEDSFIYNRNRGKGTDGILIPGKTVEYFKVEQDDLIEVVSGSINICSVY